MDALFPLVAENSELIETGPSHRAGGKSRHSNADVARRGCEVVSLRLGGAGIGSFILDGGPVRVIRRDFNLVFIDQPALLPHHIRARQRVGCAEINCPP